MTGTPEAIEREVIRVLERIGLTKTHLVLYKEFPQLPPVGVVHAGTEGE